MVRTSGVICPVIGFRRAKSYLVSAVSMVFCMMVRSSSSVSKYIFLVIRCVSSMLAIWAAVPAGFETRTPGFGSQVN